MLQLRRLYTRVVLDKGNLLLMALHVTESKRYENASGRKHLFQPLVYNTIKSLYEKPTKKVWCMSYFPHLRCIVSD